MALFADRNISRILFVAIDITAQHHSSWHKRELHRCNQPAYQHRVNAASVAKRGASRPPPRSANLMPMSERNRMQIDRSRATEALKKFTER